MKNTIPYLFLVFLLYSSAVPAQYIPLVSENRYWLYYTYDNNEKPNIGSGFLLRLEGDTTINNQEYKFVIRQSLLGTHPCPLPAQPCFTFSLPYTPLGYSIIGYIREDEGERKVYYRDKSGFYCQQEEYLLFDFSLQGMEKMDSCKIEALGTQAPFGIIDSIGEELAYNELRRTLYTTGYTTYNGLPPAGVVKIMEGLGFERFGLFHSPGNLSELHSFCEGEPSECQLLLRIKDNKARPIQIRPNPAIDFITLEIPDGQPGFYTLVDAYGRVCGQGNISYEQRLTVQDLPSGMYQMLLVQARELRVGKFVKGLD